VAETKFKAYSLRQIDSIPQFQNLSSMERTAMKAVASVLPFRVNNYVIEQLIDWSNIPDDPIFQLTFPQPGMLDRREFNQMADLIRRGAPEDQIRAAAARIQDGGHTAEVPRNCAVLPVGRSNLPCLLFILLPVGPVRRKR
jgi:hypothetical protein